MTPSFAERARSRWSRWLIAAAAGSTAIALVFAAKSEPVPIVPQVGCVIPEVVERPASHSSEGPPPIRLAVIHTSLGTITCTLDAEHAPRTVAKFAALARGDLSGPSRHPFYDGLIFHRVIPGFMIQGGDPSGTGTGGPGFEFADEISDALHFDRPGVLAMANRGPNTNGSQFFIMDAPAAHLDGHFTIFGLCDHPEVVHAIASVERNQSDKPFTPVVIEHVSIIAR